MSLLVLLDMPVFNAKLNMLFKVIITWLADVFSLIKNEPMNMFLKFCLKFWLKN